ncbi:hypothetical protein DXG01_016401 [Tephrocybe rancida]|nr:hypothetical protein DXG01_016401 [Tephrocybe rancida]
MSDDDEFGGLNPTTPLVPIRTKKPVGRTTKPNSRAEAGPSKPAKGRKNAPLAVSDNSDVEELRSPTNPFDFPKQNGADEAPARQTRSGRGDTVVIANGKPNGKGKGKAKAPQIKSVSRKPLTEPMDVDTIEVLDDTEEEHRRVPQATSKPNSRAKSTTRRGEADQISRLTEKLQRAEAQIETLSAQLEEVFSTRETEPERLFNEQQAQFEQQLKTYEDMIRELNTQLSMKEPLMRSGNSTVLNLLTREAADEEKRMVEQEVHRWKSATEQKQRDIKQRDERIATLERVEKDLRSELNAEIDRSETLAAKANRVPPSATRGVGRPVIEDPKHGEVIRFYEDVTNLIIPAMKSKPGEHGLDEWLLNCIYTFCDDNADDQSSQKSKPSSQLMRCLRSDHCPFATHQLHPPVVPRGAWGPERHTVEEPARPYGAVHGSGPRERVPRLPLFLRTLHKNMAKAVLGDSDDEGESEGGSVQEIHHIGD